jgi:hypothetical protein
MNLIQAQEVPLLLPQARNFFAEGQISGKLNEKHFVQVLSSGIAEGRMFVVVEGFPYRGAIGGAMYTDLATGEFGCSEYFWYVAEEERGSLGIRLLAEFEKEARRRNAVRMLMMHFVTEKTEKFKTVYERRQFKLREQVFVKELS